LGGLPSEVGVVVTCRTQEYEEMLASHSAGLGLVRAVEILPLTDQQLDRAFLELAKRDEDWEEFLSQRDNRAYLRVRNLLSNPLFLNLTVVGHVAPGQLLDWTTTEEELRDLVLDRYLTRTLADQRDYEPADARRHLGWIARFLNGVEVSSFGLKATDYTVFDLADLTPPEPPRRYLVFEALVYGLVLGLVHGLLASLSATSVLSAIGPMLIFALGLPLSSGALRTCVGLFIGLFLGPISWVFAGGGFGTSSVGLSFNGVFFGLFLGVIFGLARSRGTPKQSGLSTRLTLVWPSTS
jgi:hypothetical protein